ncbi:MAG: HepT-like ribonuclease domain-containing protein, partial [Parabacteroides sp.]|nr:HepT-like ribonuclease domain-containing protein [Parabacteroides sp.]
PSTPWKRIIGLRNIISHEYLSIDPLLILDIVQNELIPLQTSLKQVIRDFQSDC